MRSYIIDNALMFLTDYHVDGLRLDAVHALHDSRAVHILEEMNIEVSARSAFLGRPLPLIAESDLNDPRLITAREAGGYGLTAQWSDDFHHALYVSLTGDTSGYYADFDSLEALSKVFTDGFFHTGTRSSFRQRSHGHPIDTFRTRPGGWSSTPTTTTRSATGPPGIGCRPRSARPSRAWRLWSPCSARSRR